MSFLDWFRKKKENIQKRFQAGFNELDETINEENITPGEYDFVELKPGASVKGYVISLCEQMIDISKEMEEIRREYDHITSYLNDIQIVEGLEGEQKDQLMDVATNVAKLISARNDYMNAERKISDEVFHQMQEYEEEVPDIIRRLSENETYLDSIKRDLNRLAAEKIEWSVLRHENQEEQEKLQKYSRFFIMLFGIAAVVVITLILLYDWTTLPLLVVALLATIVGSYIVIRMQDCTKQIQKCNVNQNYTIVLENRVKIKYVNAKNAVDYTCKRFHVANARELNYNYEQYIEICKEREKFRLANEDLDYYNSKLMRILRGLNLYDARVWLNYAEAILNPKEMVEVRHDLFVRRQNVRSRMENNLKAISRMRAEVEKYIDRMGDKTSQVREILLRVDELNKGMI